MSPQESVCCHQRKNRLRSIFIGCCARFGCCCCCCCGRCECDGCCIGIIAVCLLPSFSSRQRWSSALSFLGNWSSRYASLYASHISKRCRQCPGVGSGPRAIAEGIEKETRTKAAKRAALKERDFMMPSWWQKKENTEPSRAWWRRKAAIRWSSEEVRKRCTMYKNHLVAALAFFDC